MKSEKQFSALLQVLAGEQQVIQRTDQKAFTLLSVLGVFMVFFIVHFPKIILKYESIHFHFNDDIYDICNGYYLLFSTCNSS